MVFVESATEVEILVEVTFSFPKHVQILHCLQRGNASPNISFHSITHSLTTGRTRVHCLVFACSNLRQPLEGNTLMKQAL